MAAMEALEAMLDAPLKVGVASPLRALSFQPLCFVFESFFKRAPRHAPRKPLLSTQTAKPPTPEGKGGDEKGSPTAGDDKVVDEERRRRKHRHRSRSRSKDREKHRSR